MNNPLPAAEEPHPSPHRTPLPSPFSFSSSPPSSASTEKEKPNRTTTIVLTAFLLIALLLFFWTSRWTLAGFYIHQAQAVLSDWEKGQSAQEKAGQAADETLWSAAMDGLATARQLAPGNADIPMLLGRLHHHRALRQGSSWSKAGKFHWQHTIAAYQQALALRPVWGYARILLAQAQVQAGASATEAIANVMQAITLSPWSAHVQTTSVRLGFALWQLLDGPQRATIYAQAEKAFPRFGNIILKHAMKYRQLKRIQPLLEKSPQWQKTLELLLRTR